MKYKPLAPKFKMLKIYAVYVIILSSNLLPLVSTQNISDIFGEGPPCSHHNAISLPKDKKCLVPISIDSTWEEAAVRCESYGGSLYETPDAYMGSRPDLMRCLSAISNSAFYDMWINAVGKWSPHFVWINGTWVNKVDYCTLEEPYRGSDIIPISSDTLSVDYCVSTCHDIGDRYIIFHSTKTYPECFCRRELPLRYQQICYNSETVDFSNKNAYYIVHSKEDSLIKVSGADAFTSTEILCATVNSKTIEERQMNSATCFTENQFICCLGEADKCINTLCTGPVCRFIMNNKCMLRVAIYYTWYAARAYCVNLGGDLWNMHEFNEMAQVNQHLEDLLPYWIGATNYGWTFNGTSVTLGNLPFSDTKRTRCGHMFRETGSTSRGSWKWSDAECTQRKSFLCQFNKTDFKQEDLGHEVICPWVVPIVTPAPGNDNITADNYTGLPVTEPFFATYDDDSFPIAAVIAGVIAGIILLTCLAVALTWCCHSSWMAGGIIKVRERLAFIPYFADYPVAADYEGHTAMSSVSERGSQVGLVKGEYQSATSGYAMSSSYAEQNGMFASKSMDRRQQEGMDKRFAKGHGFMVSGNSSAEEREFAAANSTMSGNTRDYMTLQAQMSILDEAGVAALRESFRRKPEVALVTDNVDMNFTVNHAVSQGQSLAGIDFSRSSGGGTVEGIIIPVTEGGITLNLPDRVVEEARVYSTMKSTYDA